MDYRNEIKVNINTSDMITIKQRLSSIMKSDSHTLNGKYEIRSLYFDDWTDKCLREKIDGVNIREKFRIRYYNGDTSFIALEKKSKINGLCKKEQAVISAAEAEKIVNGKIDWMGDDKRGLVVELYSKMKTGLRPKTIVDYTRIPFVYEPGNVRITLDFNIRTGLLCTDFLNTTAVTLPVPDNPIILEIKWDEFLPDIIRDAVNLESRNIGAFSKYAACRSYI